MVMHHFNGHAFVHNNSWFCTDHYGEKGLAQQPAHAPSWNRHAILHSLANGPGQDSSFLKGGH